MNPNRLDEIFQCIVEAYIESAEPIGSRTVSQRYEGNLSPATIRNVMGELEELGFIAQPHTSAGRVPTDRGYRHYVDSLIDSDDLTGFDVPDITPILRNAADIEDASERLSRLLAELTGNAGILYLKNAKRISYLSDLKNEMRDLREKLTERGTKLNDRLYLDGASNIVHQPEFNQADAIRALLKQLEAKDSLATLLEQDMDEKKVQIHIGAEVKIMQMPGISIVVKEYSIGGSPIGCLAVMGPTRMKYDETIQVVTKMSEAMTEFLNDL